MRETKSKIVCLFVALVMLTLAAGISSATAKLDVSVTTQRDPTGATNMQVAMPDLGPAQLKSLPSGEVVQLGKLLQGGEPGNPMLPYALVRVLVPPDADLATAKAELASGIWEDLPGEHEIAPAPPAAHTDADNPVISWGNKDKSVIVNGRDSTIYGTDAYFPAETVQVVSVGQFRQWKLVEFRVWMAAYNPVQKKVRILRNASAALSVEKLPANLAVGLSSSTLPVLPGAAKYSSRLLEEVDNPQDLETFYGGSGEAPSLIPADYVIITTSTIVTNSTKLASFIADKALVYTVKTVVEGPVADDTHYVTGATCDARANNIRSWLQNHYLGDGTDYVLLIGNPHPDTWSVTTSVPMKWTWPRSGAGSDESAPSDMYFAELSNTWNLDGDGRYGEFNGDYGAGGCDKFCEVTVGRIPFYGTYADLDSILQKSIDYHNAGGDLSWRAKVLIPAAISNFGPQDNSPWGNYKGPEDYDTAVYGDSWGQAIKGLAPTYGFSSYTLYEKSGLAFPATACNAAITQANVVAEWPNDYGFVTWWGHGSQTGAYRRVWVNDNQIADGIPQFSAETSDIVFFRNTDCPSLDDNKPSFVVQVSCNNSYPENSSNLGYSLLKQGAVGTISGTRVTWYALAVWNVGLAASVGDNASYGYNCFDQMAGTGVSLGDALVWCRANFGTNWVSGSSWMNMVDLTLYGDPSLSLSIQQLIKWTQPPDDTENGIDIRCDRSDGITRTLAEDFLCTTTGPITKVTIWGSWFNDIKGNIKKIHLSIHSDDPCGPSGWSQPDQLLWSRDFYPADFTETVYKTLYDYEWFWDPVAYLPPPTSWADSTIWQYDISIDPSRAFVQQGDPCNPIVYWLDAYVELDQNTPGAMFGWKTSSRHWNDDAVWSGDEGLTWNELRYPPEHPYYPDSIDLAFALVTGEEVGPNDIKWSQPPVPHPDYEDTYIGWDEIAHDKLPRMVLDDFLCDSNKPITAIRWWGSLLGWCDSVIPYNELPYAFYITIWDNVPAGVDVNYSHPGKMIWRGSFCDTYDVKFYGWEYDPRTGTRDLAKFEFYQEIKPEEYWYQPNDVNIYWLGIMAIYGDIPYEPNYPWGWETREHYFEDDAVRFLGWPEPNTVYPPYMYEPIEWMGETWDLSFELITKPRLPIKPLIEHSKWSQPPIEIDPGSEIPEYSGWDEPSFKEGAMVRFPCWDIPRQCHGDADGLKEGTPKTGYYYVGNIDMAILTAAWGGVYPNPPYDHCADFNRDFIIDNADQTILNTWYMVKEWPDGPNVPPDCPPEGDHEVWNLVADDFRCLGEMPVTSVHWWGSYYGWEQPGGVPPQLPIGWKICFWSNVPAGAVVDYSYPEVLLWQIDVDANRVKIDEVGTDSYHPEETNLPNDVCFQYHIDLEPNEWFWQGDFEPNTIDDVFWLSIAAVYDPCVEHPDYPWGWKTRPWHWMDDAVRFPVGPIELGMVLNPHSLIPIKDPIYQESVDVAFELDTDPNYIKWEQHYTGIRDWPHYEDQNSIATVETTVVEEIKWTQNPDLSLNGIDVDATRETKMWPDQVLADDFPCTMTGPITEIIVYGSWLFDKWPNDNPFDVTFTLSIHEDLPIGDPRNPYPWSIPGELLWLKTFYPGEFDAWPESSGIPEGWYMPCSEPPEYWPGADTMCIAYYFWIPDPCAFWQQEGNIYWLDVQAVPSFDPTWPEPIRFGWKNTYPEYFNDDAVWAIGKEPVSVPGPWNEMWYPMGHPWEGYSMDLAFQIFTYGMPKWEQPPILEPDYGVDVDATKEAIGIWWLPQVLADDFNCTQTGPITNIRIWGSWYHDYQGNLDHFTLSIHDDIPASQSPTGYSMPGTLLWERDFYPGQFVEQAIAESQEGYFVPCEPYYEPIGDWTCWQYDFPVSEAAAFVQQEGRIYWLDVQAHLIRDPWMQESARFGWKTRDPCDGHFMDDAVWRTDEMPVSSPWEELRYPPGHPLEGTSIDLAFEITTLKEYEELVLQRRVADDWLCEEKFPITAIVWWGSYLGYQFKPCHGPFMDLPVKPDYFDITIWTDVPANPPVVPFSHPNDIIWQYKAYDYDEVLVGYDKHPHGGGAAGMAGIAQIREQAMSASANVPAGPQKTNVGEERPVVFTGHVLSTEAPCGTCSSILYAPSEADDAAYRAAISAACGGATVDYYDARVGTPSVALLSTYDCVHTWANASYANNVQFGDNLADYVDAGGKVVLGVFCTYTTGNYLSGRIMTSAYCPVISPTGTNHVSLSSYAGDGTTCIHNGITNYDCVYRDYLVLQGSGIQDGSYLDGEIAHAYRPDLKVIYSNGSGTPLGGGGQWPELICNACSCTTVSQPREPVFRYSVRIDDPNDWFYQEDVNNIYWLSVVAVYDANIPNYNWGWTNHQHVFNDDAAAWEQDVTGMWHWVPLEDQTGMTTDMSFILFTVPECFPRCHPDYNTWLAVGEPNCWCCPRQCHGDADCMKEYIKGKGYYYCHFKDLNLLVGAWDVRDPPQGPGMNWPDPNICADFDHKSEYIKGKGYYRVHFKDLNVLVGSWDVREPPQGLGIDPNCLDCP